MSAEKSANSDRIAKSCGKATDPKLYRVGIDVGLYSVGLAAIEVETPQGDLTGQGVLHALPKKILNAQSVIHDAGIEEAKTAQSRKECSGVARRARRLRKQYRKRLNALDSTLLDLGYTLTKLDEQATYAPWEARIRLVEEYIKDEKERKELVALACRHIARHRGWRNPYQKPSQLIEKSTVPGELYLSFIERQEAERIMQSEGYLALTGSDKTKQSSAQKEFLEQKIRELKLATGWTEEQKQKKRRGSDEYEPVFKTIDGEKVPDMQLVPPKGWDGYLTPAQMMKPYLHQKAQIRTINGEQPSYKNDRIRSIDPLENLKVRLGKLNQSNYVHELNLIFEKQKVPGEHRKVLLEGNMKQSCKRKGKEWHNIIGGVFSAVNPRDVGAAADLVGHDELPGQEKYFRASKASLAFQRYRIVATVMNLCIGSKNQNRPLTPEEVQWVVEGRDVADVWKNGLFNLTPKEIDEISWDDVAQLLGIDRTDLQGVGGSRNIRRWSGEWEKDEDGKLHPKEGTGEWIETNEPVSAKRPPVLTTIHAILNAEGKDNELKPLVDWWETLEEVHGEEFADVAKERFIESVGNAGRSKAITEIEKKADSLIDTLISEELDEDGLTRLEKLGNSLPSGRAAYSSNSLNKLWKRMLKDTIDLHFARAVEFFVPKELRENIDNPNTFKNTYVENRDVLEKYLLENDNWKPKPVEIDEQTGSPAVDRTLKIISRWLKACEKQWGKPATINIEHVREGFGSVKASRDIIGEQTKRYNDNQKAIAEILEQNSSWTSGISSESIRGGDTKRIQAINRQQGKCAYCGINITMQNSQIDHVQPQAGVGTNNALDNLVATCTPCNLGKGKQLFISWVANQSFTLDDVVSRVNNEWLKDSWMSAKQWKAYKSGVIHRLKAKEMLNTDDLRQMESVAWMARELRERVEGRYEYQLQDLKSVGDKLGQRVYVYRGAVTALARKVGQIEEHIHWIGGASRKSRLDRRHHAVDASVIALMSPAVAQVLNEQNSLKRRQSDFYFQLQGDIKKTDKNGNVIKNADGTDAILKSGERLPCSIRAVYNHAMEKFESGFELEGWNDKQGNSFGKERFINQVGDIFWQDYFGESGEFKADEFGGRLQDTSQKFRNWQEFMNKNHGEGGLIKLLNDGFDDGSVLVTRQLRLKLGNSANHDDSIGKMKMKAVGDSWTLDELDRVQDKGLWVALRNDPDFELIDVKGKEIRLDKAKDDTVCLPANPSRRIRWSKKRDKFGKPTKDKWLDATDKIGVMKGGISQDASPLPVRGGYAAQGNSVHHARFYRIPKLNSKGVQTGTEFAMLRVFGSDLQKAKGQRLDLFAYPLKPQDYSMRFAVNKLRHALEEGTAELLGWAVVGDEVLLDVSKFIEGDTAINKFMRCFNEKITKNGKSYDIKVDRFVLTGIQDGAIVLKPAYMAIEGLELTPLSKDREKIVSDILTKGEDGKNEVGRIRKDFELIYNNVSFEDNTGIFVEWEDKDKLILSEESKKNINNINTIFADIPGLNGNWHPAVDVLLSTSPKFIRRTTLGEERWHKPKVGNLPVSWCFCSENE